LVRGEVYPVQCGEVGPPAVPAQLVAEPVEHSLSQIRLQRADTTRLEVSNPLERLKQRVLDKVVGIRQVAGPVREPAPGPSLERLEVARKQALERALLAAAMALVLGCTDRSPTSPIPTAPTSRQLGLRPAPFSN
jgi:hypothetical protein